MFLFLFFYFFIFFFLSFFRATPVAYGGSQASGLIRVVATSLQHSHSNARSELRLRPTLQLMAMLDPTLQLMAMLDPEQGQGQNTQPHGS